MHQYFMNILAETTFSSHLEVQPILKERMHVDIILPKSLPPSEKLHQTPYLKGKGQTRGRWLRSNFS